MECLGVEAVLGSRFSCVDVKLPPGLGDDSATCATNKHQLWTWNLLRCFKHYNAATDTPVKVFTKLHTNNIDTQHTTALHTLSICQIELS